MNKQILLAIVSLLISIQVFSQDTPPEGTPYITMTVSNNATISLDLKALEENTTVWIETSAGNYTQVTVGTYWTDYANYTAEGTTMKIHGDIDGVDFFDNNSKLTGLEFSSGFTNLEGVWCNKNQISNLEISNLTDLVYLYCQNNKLTSLDLSSLENLKYFQCYENDFDTQAIDDIFCSLPVRTSEDFAIISIANNTYDANHEEIIASNAQNAKDKNWNVWYYSSETDVPTTGEYDCNSGGTNISENISTYFTIYPNPASQSISIDIDGETETSDIIIYNKIGKQIIYKKAKAGTNTLDISSLSQGIYFVKIGEETKKLVKN